MKKISFSNIFLSLLFAVFAYGMGMFILSYCPDSVTEQWMKVYSRLGNMLGWTVGVLTILFCVLLEQYDKRSK